MKDEFLEQIEKYKDEFYRYIYRVVWDTSVADDVFSEAVLAAYKSREKFTPGSNFRAWMYRIITNKCYVANRHISRRGESLDQEGAREFAALGDAADYSNVLDDPKKFLDDCGDEINRAFRKLSTAERSCLLLRSAEGLSYQDIANTIDIPVGTVMTHLSRGRAKLRRELLEFARDEGIVKPALKILGADEADKKEVM